MARPSRPQLLARLRYASGDLASDRRADALALRPKLRAEYESLPAGQDSMRCEQCGKELARCLADGDATNCCHHRGALEPPSAPPGTARLWSCCQGAEASVGCQLGGSHAYRAVHATYDSLFVAGAATSSASSTLQRLADKHQLADAGPLPHLPPRETPSRCSRPSMLNPCGGPNRATCSGRGAVGDGLPAAGVGMLSASAPRRTIFRVQIGAGPGRKMCGFHGSACRQHSARRGRRVAGLGMKPESESQSRIQSRSCLLQAHMVAEQPLRVAVAGGSPAAW